MIEATDYNGDVSLVGVMSIGMRLAYMVIFSPIFWLPDLMINGGF